VKASANWSSHREAHSSTVGIPMNVWIRLSDLHRVPVKCQNDHYVDDDDYFSCLSACPT